jgi:ABC-type multidrug transport system ATPase subunit
MGEKCRVAFGKIMLSKANLLILDEPTNFMDIVSREKIEEVLQSFKGAIILVSHDRYFIKRVANRIMEIESLGVKCYDGDYGYYLEKKNAMEMKERLEGNIVRVKDEISRLECEIAFISGRLDSAGINAAEKEELNKRFLETARLLNQYRGMMKK